MPILNDILIFLHVLIDVLCVMFCGWGTICLLILLFGDELDGGQKQIVKWSLWISVAAIAWLVFDFS